MGGDEERARVVLEQNPHSVLHNALSTRKFSELVEICGSDKGASALVEQTVKVLRGASPKENFESSVEIWGDREVALAVLKRLPRTLETAQPKKKFDELVLLKGGSEAARAEVLELLSQKPGLLTNMRAARKLLGASSE
jgi:hypothetical protein